MNKYCIVLNFTANDYQDQIKRMLSFVEQNSILEGHCGLILLGERDSTPEEAQLLSAFQADEAFLLYAKNASVPETYIESLSKLLKSYDICLFSGNFFGEELAIRTAFRCGGSSLTDVERITAIQEDNALLNVERPLYSGYVTGLYTMKQKPFCITVSKSVEPKDITPPVSDSHTSICDVKREEILDTSGVHFDQHFEEVSKGNGLSDAKRIAAIGRGIKNKTNAQIVQHLADQLGFTLGASRPAVMNAWVPMEKLIGVSGSIVHPEICFTLGISGSPAFYAGVEHSKTIIAVNSDPDAPIRQKCDVFVPLTWEDLTEALQKILNKLPQETEAAGDHLSKGNSL